MQSIKDAMKGFSKEKDVFQQLNKWKEQLLEEPVVKTFLSEHPEVTPDMINRSLPKVLEYVKGTTDCHQCPSLLQCKNIMKGYEPKLFVNGNVLDIRYERCMQKKAHDEMKRKEELVQSYYIPKEVLGASFESLDKSDQNRFEAIRLAADFVKSVSQGKETPKGLYFYGKFGVGKTYIMGAIANALAKKNIKTILVYTPDFFREMKNSIGDQTLNQKLEMVKKVPVLVLDDIGAENLSSWIRDEVLGPILQYRMMEKLPTLYTSNYDYNELEEHLAYSQKSGIEELKAKRIMERVRHLTNEAFIGGSNRRE